MRGEGEGREEVRGRGSDDRLRGLTDKSNTNELAGRQVDRQASKQAERDR